MRIILYTGKGGVGKTSVAAATACKLADSGKKVLIMSTDAAHSLGDSFNMTLGGEPLEVCQNLEALEVDTVTEGERAWGQLQNYMQSLLTLQGGDGIETEELLVFPGFEELFSLFKMMAIYDTGAYDVLIVDCAPTGETLSLLKFPEMFTGFLQKAFAMKRKALKVAGPLLQKTTKIPMPKDTLFDEIDQLIEKLEALQALMKNPEILSIRIVTTPEKIVVQESKRNFSYLHLYGYNVDALIINKIYPEASLSGYFGKWIENQKKSLEDIYKSFEGLPIFKMPFLKTELRTLPRLREAAALIYESTDPMAILFKNKLFTLEQQGQTYVFCLALPLAHKEDLELSQQGDELILAIKNQHRSFMLPKKLRGCDIKEAKYENDTLKITLIPADV